MKFCHLLWRQRYSTGKTLDKKHCRALAINRNIVPTVQVTVEIYSGTLTKEQTFGIDPQKH